MIEEIELYSTSTLSSQLVAYVKSYGRNKNAKNDLNFTSDPLLWTPGGAKRPISVEKWSVCRVSGRILWFSDALFPNKPVSSHEAGTHF